MVIFDHLCMPLIVTKCHIEPHNLHAGTSDTPGKKISRSKSKSKKPKPAGQQSVCDVGDDIATTCTSQSTRLSLSSLVWNEFPDNYNYDESDDGR